MLRNKFSSFLPTFEFSKTVILFQFTHAAATSISCGVPQQSGNLAQRNYLYMLARDSCMFRYDKVKKLLIYFNFVFIM